MFSDIGELHSYIAKIQYHKTDNNPKLADLKKVSSRGEVASPKKPVTSYELRVLFDICREITSSFFRILPLVPLHGILFLVLASAEGSLIGGLLLQST